MPVLSSLMRRQVEHVLDKLDARELGNSLHTLIARINIPHNSSSPLGLIEANTVDPFNKSGKYALGWVYFGVILLVFTAILYMYHSFTDRIRAAMHQEEVLKSSATSSPSTDYELSAYPNYPYPTDKSTNKFFPRSGELPSAHKTQSSISAFRPIHLLIAVFRLVFYRPVPEIRLRKGWRPIAFPPLSIIAIVFAGLAFSMLYTFVPQPLFWDSIQYGSPPVAVRSGMLAVALLPWIVASAMKANLISVLTGIGHERLNVLHRWGAYLCMALSLVHTIPFYVTAVWDADGLSQFKNMFQDQHFYVYGTGLAALVPLCVLTAQSLPFIRKRAYELFVVVHVPVSMVFLGMMFWHCHNYLTSWRYLFATLAIWLTSYMARLFFLNWTNPFRMAWLIGDESAITVLPENAVKITIPTQVRWKPGQYVYIRMPGISMFENHPFTIASLCSEDFPSEYGENYRDMIIVFRPFGGFTRKVFDTGIERGPWQTYRAFIDGPYGGMRRRLESFDKVVLIAGGSGITAIVSQLLDLIKRMRDGKALTQDVQVIWALKRPDTLEWFKEELRICRECAPPEAVKCQFFITTAKRPAPRTHRMTAQTTQKHISTYLHDKVNETFQGVAEKRASYASKRNSAYIREEAEGDVSREKELRAENEDVINPLPRARIVAKERESRGKSHAGGRNLAVDIKKALEAGSLDGILDPEAAQEESFNFGFPSTPTEFQKNLMRFAFLPAATRAADGWSTEYGRPDLPYMLRQMSKQWGKRTCVFVCGPPSMRVAVSNTVADLQKLVLGNSDKEEIFLHTENYAL
ncbi:metalloreductase-like protein transmembrane component [Tothia fuscella]|uniref:ferric-chelate reductase (NADPH) n=1 Tax=Tothia fuscella TaxID=1048955 RepID=A0A9P4NQV2_9PEZI|nr:metalloreductase-like protein transmembrane component [Tothia fuscella]